MSALYRETAGESMPAPHNDDLRMDRLTACLRSTGTLNALLGNQDPRRLWTPDEKQQDEEGGWDFSDWEFRS